MTSNLVTAAIATLAAREYRRVSPDRSGNTRSVDEQGDDNGRAREGAPYVDNDRSAGRYPGTGVRTGRDHTPGAECIDWHRSTS